MWAGDANYILMRANQSSVKEGNFCAFSDSETPKVSAVRVKPVDLKAANPPTVVFLFEWKQWKVDARHICFPNTQRRTEVSHVSPLAGRAKNWHRTWDFASAVSWDIKRMSGRTSFCVAVKRSWSKSVMQSVSQDWQQHLNGPVCAFPGHGWCAGVKKRARNWD